MEKSFIFGIIISILDAWLFLPQAIIAWRNRHEPEKLEGISTFTYVLVLLVYVLWIIWDILVGRWDAHLYAWVGIPLAASIIIIKFKYKNKKDHSATS
jgi:uncharacterized protein with PQ loop repeat